MANFIYKNAKNASTDYKFAKLNYGYHPRIFFRNRVYPYSKSCLANKSAMEPKKLISIYLQNLPLAH